MTYYDQSSQSEFNCSWYFMLLALAVAVPTSIKLLADVLMDIKQQCCRLLNQPKTKKASRAVFL